MKNRLKNRTVITIIALTSAALLLTGCKESGEIFSAPHASHQVSVNHAAK
jgi:hypothetical protein